MVYERLGIKKVWDGKKEYCSEKNPEKKEGKSGRYTEILQIFHMTVMILGIFMEKISRVPAAGRNWTRSCGQGSLQRMQQLAKEAGYAETKCVIS